VAELGNGEQNLHLWAQALFANSSRHFRIAELCLQEFLLYTTLESGNVSVLHVYEKNTGKEIDAGGLRHKSRGRPYDVIAYADSQQPFYNSE